PRSPAGVFGRLPRSFEANLGETEPSVQFLSRGSGSTLTPTAAVLNLQQTGGAGAAAGQAIQADAIFMRFAGANPAPHLIGQDELPGRVNDFTGGDLARPHGHPDLRPGRVPGSLPRHRPGLLRPGAGP